MSADNYYYVQRHPLGGWAATMGFASDDMVPFARLTDTQFVSVTEAMEWAFTQYSEYGVTCSAAVQEGNDCG